MRQNTTCKRRERGWSRVRRENLMKNRSTWCACRIVVLGVLLSLVAVAADVSGKWKAEFTTPDGTQRVNTFTFKVEAGNLTGTVAGSQDETPIKNGKIAG